MCVWHNEVIPFGALMFLYFIHEAVQRQIFIILPALIKYATVHRRLMNARLNMADVRNYGGKQHCMVLISIINIIINMHDSGVILKT